MRIRILFVVLCLVTLVAFAVTAQQNLTNQVRPIPPPGIAVPAADRIELEAGIAALGQELESLRVELKSKPALLALLPDVQIYFNAARYALNYNEFYKPEEIKVAKTQLQQGLARAQALRTGKPDWTTQTGLVVRGYVSEIDGSVQPYGLVIPSSYQPATPHLFRLDAWFHGRGENLTELNFIADRQKNVGQFAPPNAFVLHLYGRYCNANKFAGEVDLFEALAAVRQAYPIDENRISARGFSMGGAATWHIGTHYAGLWAAVAPGAGFAETPEYTKTNPADWPWYERKLWHWYNATDYALNLYNTATVAYSGEIDKQIQAANVMARELKREGIELVHLIGPNTEHKYHPDTKLELDRRIDSIVAAGRNPMPRRVKFTTWTLRYNRMAWVTIDALGEHWERARVDAEIRNNAPVQISTQNVTALTLAIAPGLSPLDHARPPVVILDQQELTATPVLSDRSWTAHFSQRNGKWQAIEKPEAGLAKRHGLQGPIDDAFLSSFVMVRPTGKAQHERIGAWANSELQHALTQWRGMFRGEARIKDDSAITDEDIARSNLILWGDPASNKLLARILDKLPLRWDAQTLKVGDQSFAANQHAPILIYPNPLNQQRYVVLNSGFTFREADYLTNARQVPRLPDWAVVDVSTPPGPRLPGRIAAANFFGERWEWLPTQAR